VPQIATFAGYSLRDFETILGCDFITVSMAVGTEAKRIVLIVTEIQQNLFSKTTA
jgi:hypothetical protein